MKHVWTAALLTLAAATLGPRAAIACTAFCAVGSGGQVLVGNNEDWFNPRSKLWFIPAKPGAYGRMYVGFDDMWPFGGMNDHGLWYDAFAAPPMRAAGSADLPSYSGEIINAVMSQCATVEEAVQVISRYNRSYLTEGILMFADASGDAVSIEANAIVRKHGARHVQTNFHQSRGIGGGGVERYQTASSMLERAGADISVDLFRRILAATHQEGAWPTQYSNVYDLKSRTMYLYHFHDFDHVVTFRLDDELKKGERVLDIPSLFPRNAAADAFAAARPAEGSGSQAPAVALAVMLGAAVVAAIVSKERVQFSNASMAHITDALQAILGKPVVDETGLSERYDFELTWQNPPLQPVTAALHDRFGLDLTPARVEMETLVIDHARRDPALFLLAQAGRLTRFAPAFVRKGVGSALTID